MRLLNAFFVTVAVGLAMCFAQVGHSQYQDFQNHIDYLNALVNDAGEPHVRNSQGVLFRVSNIRDLFLLEHIRPSWFHDTSHTIPSTYDVGRVFERLPGGGIRGEYTGPIDWAVRTPLGGVWASGTATHSYHTPPFDPTPTNIIRAPRGRLVLTPPGDIPSGAIYALTAELDGEFYGGQSPSGLLTWGLTEVWEHRNGNSSLCPTGCTRWTIAHANVGSNTPPGVNLNFGSVRNIYLHPRSVVQVLSAPPGMPIANRMVRYVFNQNGRELRWQKPTNAQGWCHFNVNWRQTDEGFSVFYDGCWHPIPRRLTGCTNALCFDIALPAGRVTLTIRRFGVPLQGCSVRVLNGAGTALYTDVPLTSSSTGTVLFTPPATTRQNLPPPIGQPSFSLLINIGNVQTWTNPITVPTEPLPVLYDSTLISPVHQADYTAGSTLSVPFRWHTLSGGANYRLWLRHNFGSWTPYDLGNFAGVDLPNPPPGTWQWDVEVFNASGQMIGHSEMRTFTVVQHSPSPMGGWLDDSDFWGDEFVNDDDSIGLATIVDMDGNVLSPTQGLERTLERTEADTGSIGIRAKIALDENGRVPSEAKHLLLLEGKEFVDLESLQLSNPDLQIPADTFDSDRQDDLLDWLLMTPEEQFLMYLEYLFGEFDNP